MNLFEAAEGIGVRREELVGPFGLDAAALVDPRIGIEWETLVVLLDRLSDVVGGDVERVRDVGRKMAGAPSFAFIQRIAQSVVSLRSVYLAGERWVAAANVPHLILRTTFPADDRLRFRCSIPEAYAPSAPYLHVFEGLLCEVPTMIGLAPATILTTELTPRELDITLQLPPSRSLATRARRLARAAVHRAEALRLLEAQRREIADGLEAVQRSTAEIHSLFDRIPNFVVIHRDGRIVWLNRAVAKTFGDGEVSGVLGRPLVDLFHASSRAAALEQSDGAVDDASAPDLVEAKMVARDGGLVLVEASPAQAITFGGRCARLFVARDVTERRRLQQQLAMADRLASVGMLAAGVAHEVNNPLAYVLNNVEIALRDLGPLGAPADSTREALTVALEGVTRIRTIVQELLALARVEDVAIGAVDARAIVESTLKLARPQIAERAELVCELGPTPPVLGTPSRIGQVLLNLIANALDAMPSASRATNVLRVAVSASTAGGAVIDVTDNGVGIPPEHAARIFDPFFTTKAQGKGTGLGLAISHRLISEVGGDLAFESNGLEGTTFRVTLPSALHVAPRVDRGAARAPGLGPPGAR
ncbi:MAG: PAS domain S-box protein [Labilithrix sp.]|nr:PAS domain S-box protein [Labilithrix sp.]